MFARIGECLVDVLSLASDVCHPNDSYAEDAIITLRPVPRFVPVVIAGACCFSPPTSAEPLQIIIRHGVTVPARLADSGVDVSVVDGAQIETSRAAATTQLLRPLRGVHIDRSGGAGGVSSLYLRGADPNYTAVYIDGVKVNDPTNTRGGSFDFSTLDAGHFERIDVMRGPLSAAYGSDAMSGVVNMLTRRGAGAPALTLDAEAGERGFYRLGLFYGGSSDVSDYAVYASRTDHGTPAPSAASRMDVVGANAGRRFDDARQIRTTLRHVDSFHANFPDDSGGPRHAARRDVDRRDVEQLIWGVEYRDDPQEGWGNAFALGVYDRSEDFRSPGVAPGVRDPFGIPPNARTDSFTRIEATASIGKRTQATRLLLGAQRAHEDGASRGALFLGADTVATDFELDRGVWSVFAEAERELTERWKVLAGLRWDRPDEDFDAQASPRVAITYRAASERTTLRTSWGESFKLPSFYALGHPVIGNTELRPEQGRSVEVGITQALWQKRLALDAVLFRSEYTDAVDFEEGPPPRLVNRDRVEANGAELGLEAVASATLRGRASVTYVETDIAQTDEELRNRPEWQGGLSALWRAHPGVDVSISAIYVDRVLDSSIPTGDRRLSDYSVIDAAVTWKLARGLRLHAAIDNLFDEQYEEFVGFPAPRRTVRIGVRCESR